jgi:hypothetical protein
VARSQGYRGWQMQEIQRLQEQFDMLHVTLCWSGEALYIASR